MRIALMVIRLFWIAPYYLIRIWWCGVSRKISFEESFQFIKKVTKKANHAGRVTIETYGIENMPKEDGFIFYPNHQGLYDVLAIIEACPRPFSVVMKKEVQNVPFLKQVFACMKAYAIDRDDLKQSMKVIIKVSQEVMQGRNFLIFAEGTRSRNGNQLLDFKGGSFKAAMKAKCPIVPVALIDSYKSFDTNSIKSLTVQVHFLKPLVYEEYKDMKSVEIAAEVKGRIEGVIEKNA